MAKNSCRYLFHGHTVPHFFLPNVCVQDCHGCGSVLLPAPACVPFSMFHAIHENPVSVPHLAKGGGHGRQALPVTPAPGDRMAAPDGARQNQNAAAVLEARVACHGLEALGPACHALLEVLTPALYS